MIINLRKSKLFTTPPALRFAKEYDIEVKMWDDVWRKYVLSEYDFEELCAYLHYKTDKKLTPQTMKRWIRRTEIYSVANGVMKMGVRVVQSEFFGHLEEDVVNELTRHMRFGETKETRSLA